MKSSKGFAHIFLLIIIFVFATAGILYLTNKSTTKEKVSRYSRKAECEKANPGYECEYKEHRCNFDTWSTDECQKLETGWYPTNRKEIQTANGLQDWKTYGSTELKIEFKYPEEMKIISSNEAEVELATKTIQCKTEVAGDMQDVDVNELKITTRYYPGVEFEDAWRGMNGFEFNNNYDGRSTIGGKPAHFYYQSAESLYGRKAILVKIDEKNSMEINIYTPILAHDCTHPLRQQKELNDLADRILSTFKFK